MPDSDQSLSGDSATLRSIEDGSRSLLLEAVTVLSNFESVEYAVIGGWCPAFRNTCEIEHPGTLDVDLLFRKSNQSGYLKDVIEGFINSGFIPSAKHDFQLLRKKNINGNYFIYNVDLLHPDMLDVPHNGSMFVDHLDFDVPLNNAETHVKQAMSIVLPNSEIIFSQGLYSSEKIDKVNFNLITFEGMFLTKMDSCQKKKRERDSFDIYIGFLNSGISAQNIKNLAKTNKRIRDSLGQFNDYVKNNKDVFNRNVRKYCDPLHNSPAQYIIEQGLVC